MEEKEIAVDKIIDMEGADYANAEIATVNGCEKRSVLAAKSAPAEYG